MRQYRMSLAQRLRTPLRAYAELLFPAFFPIDSERKLLPISGSFKRPPIATKASCSERTEAEVKARAMVAQTQRSKPRGAEALCVP